MRGHGREEIRVLHVDDQPGLAESAGLMMESHDDRLAVQPETDPTTVLDHLADGEFDCVISDYEMPRLDGLELLERVREQYPELPFILYTGKGSEEVASDAIALGVTDYLQKSTGSDQYEVLSNRVTNAVEAHWAEQQVERDHRAMNAAWDGITILDETGRFTYVNDAYADTFGYDPDDLLGERWSRLYPEANQHVVDDEILPAVHETGIWTGETSLERADGSQFVGEHTVAKTSDGGVVCVIRDRTERQELDRELRYERERFRLLVEAVEEYAMFTLDPEGRVTSWNAGAERINGYEEAEILGEHLSAFYTDEAVADGLPGQLLEQAAEDGYVTDEGRRVRKDGSTFWADVTITALRENGNIRGFAKVTKDITDQKKQERQRERTETYRQRLYEITTDRERTFEEKVTDVLELGVDYLDVEHGHLVEIDAENDRHQIVAVSDDHPEISIGEESPLSETYCRKAIRVDDILTLHDAAEQGWADDPAYEAFGLETYLGAKLESNGDLFGTTCFVDRDPRGEPFRPDEKTFIELLSRWLVLELERRSDRSEIPLEAQ